MTRLVPMMPCAIGLTLAAACATAPPSTTMAPLRAPDCSFRSASTCWTLAGRFPVRRPVAKDTMPETRLAEPPAVFAAATDSSGRHLDTHQLRGTHP